MASTPPTKEIALLLLLLAVITLAALARRLRTPYPILLVIRGLLLLGFVRGMPRIAPGRRRPGQRSRDWPHAVALIVVQLFSAAIRAD